MTTLTKIKAEEARTRMADGSLTLIDIRDPDEFAREHVAGARSVPLTKIQSGEADLPHGERVAFMCRSGNRTDVHCAALEAAVGDDAMILEGGLMGWQAAGLPTKKNESAPLEIMRQVQITAGSLTLLGVILGFLVNPAFFGLSAFIGAGLTFAGVSGWCGMAKLLGAMPWNRTAAA
ncbi:DUF2892 domain-containing protein [Parvularcula sp. ZS-1/3]|uniref:DUF2892 domain-containing protein n=1 Tax=Parvularcula mediterranea TaxID=2732508 RepID=A0A7Y3RIQ7_9PROT|nr:rhodanese family protein [Parvularcula mediterranea]NNU14803.1 DUF2892 domain-containing protein [Parvularcula mediterranea]